MSNRFDQVIDAFEPDFRRAFLDAVYTMRDTADFPQIVRMLENGDVDGAIRAVGLDPSSLRLMDSTRIEAFQAAGDYTARVIPTLVDEEGFRTTFQFGVRNPEAEAWLRQQAAEDVVEILGDQRTAIRNFLTAGLEDGANPRTSALDLVGRVSSVTGRREGGVIGLTSSQEEWVRNYEDELRNDPSAALDRALRDKRFDAAVNRALASEEPIPDAMIDKMVTAYKNRALRYRAETIARTETITAVHEAQQQAMTQAIRAGAVAASAVTMTWNSAGDERVRDSHEELDGQSISMGEAFETEDGPIRFPGDPLADISQTINCFHPSSFISVAGLKGVIFRRYSGKMIELIIAGKVNLSVTPNHPVLTERGWVAAGQLMEGDNLVYCSPCEFAFSQPQICNGQARAQDLCDLAKLSGRVNRPVRSAVNLHGEVPDHDVEIVSFPSELRDAFKAFGMKSFGNVSLKETDVLQGGLLFQSLRDKLGFGATGVDPGVMCTGHNGAALLLSHPRESDLIGFRTAASLNAHIVKASAYMASRYSERVRCMAQGIASFVHDSYLFMKRFAFRQVECDNLFAFDGPNFFGRKSAQVKVSETGQNAIFTYAAPLGDFSNGQRRRMQQGNAFEEGFALFAPARVVGMRGFHYDGPVYNFETDNGLIIANNIVTHNCRCWLEPGVDFLAGVE